MDSYNYRVQNSSAVIQSPDAAALCQNEEAERCVKAAVCCHVCVNLSAGFYYSALLHQASALVFFFRFFFLHVLNLHE